MVIPRYHFLHSTNDDQTSDNKKDKKKKEKEKKKQEKAEEKERQRRNKELKSFGVSEPNYQSQLVQNVKTTFI